MQSLSIMSALWQKESAYRLKADVIGTVQKSPLIAKRRH